MTSGLMWLLHINTNVFLFCFLLQYVEINIFVKLPPPPPHILHFSVPKVRPVDLSLNLAVKVLLTKDYCVLYPLKYMLIFPFIFFSKS